MLAATFVAIFLIPVLFYLVERISHRKREGKAEGALVEQPAASKH
jgi:hypothetical protein